MLDRQQRLLAELQSMDALCNLQATNCERSLTTSLKDADMMRTQLKEKDSDLAKCTASTAAAPNINKNVIVVASQPNPSGSPTKQLKDVNDYLYSDKAVGRPCVRGSLIRSCS